MTISGNGPFTCKDFSNAQDWTRVLSFPVKSVDCVLKDQEGKVIFELKGAEFPLNWSDTACKIVASKYFNRKAKEKSLATLVYRVVNFVTQGINDDDLKHRLAKNIIEQKVSFNSPVWFNAGLDTYGIVKKDDTFAYDAEADAVVPISNSRKHPQMSACFIQSIDDSISSIYDLVKKEALLFKYGSGSGTNFSTLRSSNEPLSHGGASSGLMAFLPVYDRSAGAVKSGGTTRRAAKMVCLDDNHPEIMEFIEWKSKEENKARVLLEAGYSGGIDGEAYGTVSGQNSNNSIRLSDAFMRMVDEDKLNEPWHLTRRIDGSIAKTVTVGELWNAINTSSWKCADPGVQFDDIINTWHTCKESGRIRASNPCSEYMFLDDSACNLASINLMRVDFINNPEEARRLVHDMILVMDNIVGLASYPTKAIAQNSVDYRPLGLGFADLGAYLMSNGLPYDSEEGRLIAAKISNRLTCWAYEKSVLIASTHGAFKYCKKNIKSVCEVLKRHGECASSLLGGDLVHLWEFILESAKVSGIRNAQVSVVAPTGTIGFMMDCVTTGIEPDYSLVKYKSMVGGGFMPIVNTAVGTALARLGYSDTDSKRIQDHLIKHEGNLDGCEILQEDHRAVFDCATTPKNGTRSIAPSGHVLMMANVQPFISGAISKTVNMPNSATVEDIANIHLLAWRSGVKAVAVYRDGCKMFQPLTSTKTTTQPTKEPEPVRKKLGSVRRGLTIEARVGGEKIFVRTGEFEDGSLGEVFIDFSEGDSTLKGSCQAFAKLLSLSLQHGMALDELCKHFLGIEFAPFGVVVGHPNIKMSNSIIDFVFRVLSFHYMKNQSFVHIKEDSGYSDVQILTTSDNPKCTQCGNKTIRNGTCYKCENCGSTTGCS